MSLDDRIRAGLAANALDLTPAVESALDDVRRRGRSRSRRRRVGTALGLAAAVAGLYAATRLPMPSLRAATPPTSTTTATMSPSLTGRYAVQLAPADVAPTLAGGWVLDFQPSGVLRVSAPAGYHGVVSAVLFTAQDGALRTDLFAQDACSGQPLGRYTFTRAGADLRLVVVDDPCPARVSVLSSRPWVAKP